MHKFTYPLAEFVIFGPFFKKYDNRYDNTKASLSLKDSGWVKPFIIRQLCFLFLNHNDNIQFHRHQ